MKSLSELDGLPKEELESVLSRVAVALTSDDLEKAAVETTSNDVERVVGAISTAFVEAGRRGFDTRDARATLERNGGCSSGTAEILAKSYGEIKRGLEERMKRHAMSSPILKLSAHACRADYVVSTSANGDAREPGFHLSWVLSDGRGEGERVNFECDAEEMAHLVETLREACRASEMIAARSDL